MLRLSKRVEYGLMAVLRMDELAPEALISAGDIAAQYRLPADLLGKVMQAMARGGLLESVHGARGGYRLARPLDALTLGDVVVAIEGPTKLVRCQESEELCDHYEGCPIREPVLQMQAQLQDYMHAFKLATFRQPVNERERRQQAV